MTIMRTATVGLGAALLAATAGAGVAAAEPEGHQVTYTITSTSELSVDVQYIQTDPPSKAAYNADADKYLATSRRTPISPGSPLVYTVTLADPGQ